MLSINFVSISLFYFFMIENNNGEKLFDKDNLIFPFDSNSQEHNYFNPIVFTNYFPKSKKDVIEYRKCYVSKHTLINLEISNEKYVLLLTDKNYQTVCFISFVEHQDINDKNILLSPIVYHLLKNPKKIWIKDITTQMYLNSFNVIEKVTN